MTLDGGKTAPTADFRTVRPTIVGPESGPEAPYPLRMEGEVVKGYGRGKSELQIPTANIPIAKDSWVEDTATGVYFGWASIHLPDSHPDLSKPSPLLSSSISSLADPNWRIYPMVMSIGYNLFYGNKVKSAEIHIMHEFGSDFYGAQMRVCILGFIRNELNYVDLDGLRDDILTDIRVALKSLERETWAPKEIEGEWLSGSGFKAVEN
ncbi:hypothetical protein BGZ60DRAFT_478206 [Tricladium varicosporioides]|nr:hypothetical protein BGZ60DRAFT_478206 [Hymenoscyphus varicosporioides]